MARSHGPVIPRRRMRVRRRTGRRALAAACAVAALAAAAPGHTFTIDEALAEAARSNPDLRAARAAARGSHEAVPLALGAWLPTLELDAGTGTTRTGSYQNPPSFAGGVFVPGSISSHYSDERSLGLTWTQSVYHGGRHLAGLRRAEEEVARRHALVEDTEQRVLLAVATAYLDNLRAARAVGLHEASLAAFGERLRETRIEFGVGDRTRADVAQADAERRVAAADLAAARADLETQRALFLSLVGLPADGLRPAGELAGLPASVEEARRMAVDADPALRAALHAERAAGHQLRAAAGGIGPRVDLRARAARTEGTRRGAPDSTDATVGVRLTLPLYQAGAAGARLREARHARGQRRDERLAAERRALQRATAAWNDLAAARLRHAALVAAVEASRVALAGIRREAGVGERTVREVLDAERGMVSRRARLLTAERDLAVGAYRLLRAAGALTARRLGLDGLPDLAGEARAARGRLLPGALYLE